MVLRVNRLFWADGDAGIERFEQIVARHDAAGFDSELQVRYHPAGGDEGNIAKWTAYVRHVVDVLGADPHVVAMTITNEVNLDISQNTSDGAYRGATDALVKGIVAARAEANRIGRPDLTFGFTYAYRWNPSSDAQFWTALAAGGPAFRRALGFVGVDLYPGTFYPPVIAPTSSPGREMVQGIATVRRCYMPKAQLSAAVPIWITENGFQSGVQRDDAGQAAALRDMVTSTIAVSGTYHVTDYRWFNLRDNLTGSPGIFDTTGLLHDDDSPKPAFAGYRALVAEHGAPARACLRRVTFDLPRGTGRVVARVDGRRTAFRRQGRRVTVPLAGAGAHRVTVSAGQAVLRRIVLACGPVRARTASAHTSPTVVSLEFDYASADEVLALPALAAHRMHATFYVNSGLVGHAGHLTWAGLRALQAASHEIAGGSIHHLMLAGLVPPQLRHEICDDRTTLLDQGLEVNAFAYPYGAADAAAEQAVRACGYASGRLASGIRGGGRSCPGCPYAESLPPHDPLATRLPAGARATTQVASIEGSVRAAQRHGGGWVQLLFHHVCNHCDSYSITQRHLARLLDWLAAQRGVEVRTVGQLLDAQGPAIRVVAPQGTWSGAGAISIPVAVDAPAGVRSVRYFVDGHLVGVRHSAPWRLRWDSDRAGPGRHTLRAMVEDDRGTVAISRRAIFVR
jgi:peptidoglycan/xylan/chitin deacetylase (PgdA/CDA1 family)